MKVAIVYLTYGGNTKDLSFKILNLLVGCGLDAHIFTNKDNPNLNEFDYVLLGSLTWDEGKLPIQMRKYMRKILIDEPINVQYFSVFGTGETQWGMNNYCKAVEEISYHLQKHGKTVHHQLKIEQNPIGKDKFIISYVNDILKEVDLIESKSS